MLYRLNKADEALVEVVPACEKRHDDLTIKAVQALAFTRWKQGRYREALSRFHEMEGWIGKSAALSENIGHTYNTIGSYADAEGYFREALILTDALSAGDKGNRGGILRGLAALHRDCRRRLSPRCRGSGASRDGALAEGRGRRGSDRVPRCLHSRGNQGCFRPRLHSRDPQC